MVCYVALCVHHAALHSRMWRNWQTHETQNLAVATSCGFKSHHPHNTKRKQVWKNPYLFSFGILRMPQTHGFKVSPDSSSTSWLGRFDGKTVHWTVFYFRLTPPSARMVDVLTYTVLPHFSLAFLSTFCYNN